MDCDLNPDSTLYIVVGDHKDIAHSAHQSRHNCGDIITQISDKCKQIILPAAGWSVDTTVDMHTETNPLYIEWLGNETFPLCDLNNRVHFS